MEVKGTASDIDILRFGHQRLLILFVARRTLSHNVVFVLRRHIISLDYPGRCCYYCFVLMLWK